MGTKLDICLCFIVSDLRQFGGLLRLLQFSPQNTNDHHDITEIYIKVDIKHPLS
jgi:hypothetical protein